MLRRQVWPRCDWVGPECDLQPEFRRPKQGPGKMDVSPMGPRHRVCLHSRDRVLSLGTLKMTSKIYGISHISETPITVLGMREKVRVLSYIIDAAWT